MHGEQGAGGRIRNTKLDNFVPNSLPQPQARQQVLLPPNNNDLHFSEEFSSISDFDQKMGRRKNQRCVFVSHLHHRSGRGATCVVAVLLADELGPQSRI